MSRILKQILYGLFFLTVLVFSAAAIFWRFLPEPSCTNNREDWGEAGVDCGGNCEQFCIPADLMALTATNIRVFNPLSGYIALWAQIQNPNPEFGARQFEYEAIFYDAAGVIVGRQDGDSFIYPGEIKGLAVFWENPAAGVVRRAEIAIGSPDWISASEFRKPQIVLQGPQTAEQADKIEVTGRVENQDTVEVTELTIMALFQSSPNNPAGVSATRMPALGAGQSAAFSINHPPLTGVDPAFTRYFVFARRPALR